MYQPSVSFSVALEAIKKGVKMTRLNWNGKDMFIFLVEGSNFKVSRKPLLGIYPEGTDITYQSHIDIKTVDGSIVPWVGSHNDLLADDWVESK